MEGALVSAAGGLTALATAGLEVGGAATAGSVEAGSGVGTSAALSKAWVGPSAATAMGGGAVIVPFGSWNGKEGSWP